MGDNNVVGVHNGINHKEFNPAVCIKIGGTDILVTEISQTERRVADDSLPLQKGER